MCSIAALKENYQKFNPKAYLKNNYMPPRADFSTEDCVVPWKLRCLAEAFETGNIQGRTLMDIGSGPTIYQLLSACDYFDEIVMTDFLEINREEIHKWLQNDPDIFDWSPYIKHTCKIEGKGELWTEKLRKLREKVRCIYPIDIHQRRPLHPVIMKPVDALVSTFCLEAVSPDKESFDKALENITTLLKPKGYFLMIGALHETYYMAGEARIPVLAVNEQEVKESLISCGYKICIFKTYTMPTSLKIGVDDVQEIFFVQAQKM
ncbi:phenylethanolamine N-methyltransferase [Protopterus annectens]|uniref:phenylethanolamine N-methyltransferase n=1 Tax=Protopterus annectens TaxID=7888 RepID=UPI001CFAFC5F|nr:phenylethanolamine N-methyltransferase [Protopterus annectens]